MAKSKKSKPEPVQDDGWPKTPMGILHRISDMGEELAKEASALADIFDGSGPDELHDLAHQGQLTDMTDDILTKLRAMSEKGYEKVCVVLQKAQEAEDILEKLPSMFTDEDKQ